MTPYLIYRKAAEEVKIIIDELSRQVRQKKIAELRQYWQGITGLSFRVSGKKKGVPIQWVLEARIMSLSLVTRMADRLAKRI